MKKKKGKTPTAATTVEKIEAPAVVTEQAPGCIVCGNPQTHPDFCDGCFVARVETENTMLGMVKSRALDMTTVNDLMSSGRNFIGVCWPHDEERVRKAPTATGEGAIVVDLISDAAKSGRLEFLKEGCGTDEIYFSALRKLFQTVRGSDKRLFPNYLPVERVKPVTATLVKLTRIQQSISDALLEKYQHMPSDKWLGHLFGHERPIERIRYTAQVSNAMAIRKALASGVRDPWDLFCNFACKAKNDKGQTVEGFDPFRWTRKDFIDHFAAKFEETGDMGFRRKADWAQRWQTPDDGAAAVVALHNNKPAMA